MKILIIIQCANLGGMEQVTFNAAKLLREHGHEAKIWSLQPLNGLEKLCAAAGLPIAALPAYHGAGGLPDIPVICKIIKNEAPARVWIVGHNLGAVIAGKLSGVPSYLSIHYHHGEAPMWKWRLFYGVARQCCLRIHFVSRFIFDEVIALFPPAQDTVSLFYNYLPPPPASAISRQEARAQWHIPADAPVIGNAGWLIRRKAFDLFLQCAGKLREQLPQCHFIIAGGGPEEENLKKMAAELGLTEFVHFVGWQSDLQSFWSSIDLLLFQTRFDCFPTVPLEAFARGIPVVASVENSGLSEIMRDQLDGRIFLRHDPSETAAAIVTILTDQEQRDQIIKNARLRLSEYCSADTFLVQLNRFLDLS